MALLDLRDLIKAGNELEPRFDSLQPGSPAFEEWLRELQEWLMRCVDYGRFLDNGSPERRALQGRVDYWTSRLGMHGVGLPIDQLAAFDPSAGVVLDVASPFPGLKAYDENQQPDFYGRDHETADCIARLERNHILLIVGGSGSGKSSLALAGVLPALREKYPQWLFPNPFTPGVRPFEFLAAALLAVAGSEGDAAELAGRLKAQPAQSGAILAELCGGKAGMLLVIDQFEELLTLCQDALEQAAFAELLCLLSSPAVGAAGLDCRVLLTLRTDHLARLEASESLKHLYGLVSSIDQSEGILQLAPIGFEHIRQAIEKPARKVGLRFIPPSLIDALASQAASLVDGLPLLQYALRRLWEQRPRSEPVLDEHGSVVEPGKPLDFINQAMFDALPDVQGALGKVAEQVYRNLDDRQRALCTRLMLELVLLDENFEQPLRRRRGKAELMAVLSKQWPEHEVERVIAAFVEPGLLRQTGDDGLLFEVAHEAMFRNWATFRDWIAGPEAKARLHAIKLITREALDWHNHQRSADYLKLAGAPLQAAQRYVDDSWLVEGEVTDYVAACIAEEQRKAAEKRLAEQAKEAAQQAEIAKTKTKYKYYTSLAVLVLILVSAVFYALWAQARLNTQQNMIHLVEQERKSAALNVLPWILASKTQAPIDLDLTYSSGKYGGSDFRYVLALALDNMDDKFQFTPRGSSNALIVGQGSAVLQFDNAVPQDKALRVYRLCEDGRLDQAPIEIRYGQGQLAAQANVSPPVLANGSDTRWLILPFKVAGSMRGWEVAIHRLQWPAPACAVQDKPDSGHAEAIDSARQSFPDASDFSDLAFSADGRYAAFSVVSYKPRIQSAVWLFDAASQRWQDASPASVGKDADDHQDVVSALAFSGELRDGVPELITGRLNGAVYCGGKIQPTLDASQVQQISVSRLRSAGKSDNWLVDRHLSGQTVVRQCNGSAEPLRLTLDKQEATAGLSLRDIDFGADGGVRPVVSYVADKRPQCWELRAERWRPMDCGLGDAVTQFVMVNPQYAVAVEPGAVLRRIRQRQPQFSNQAEARVAGEAGVVWPKAVGQGTTAGSATRWQAMHGSTTTFKAIAGTDVEILWAAVSPHGHYIAWLDGHIDTTKIDLHIYNVESRQLVELPKPPELDRKNIDAVDLVVTDDGMAILGVLDKLHLYSADGVKEEAVMLSRLNGNAEFTVDPNINCLNLSEDGKRLVIGTKGGMLVAAAVVPGNLLNTEQKYPYMRANVAACAVDNSGLLVGGYETGAIEVFPADSAAKPFVLPLHAAIQVTESVHTLSLDLARGYLAALFDKQSGNCTASGLSGQSVRIWSLDAAAGTPLVSNYCIPNRDVLAIGRLHEQDGGLHLPVVFADTVELRPCRGCAAPAESADAVLQRLMAEAMRNGAEEKGDMREFGIELKAAAP